MATAISSKFYVIDFKQVIEWREVSARKKGNLKIEGICHDVIENTWWKNVAFRPCHDIDDNKRHTPGLPRCL